MALLQLPNELLCTILDLTRPYAFEALVLTCKHVYSAASPILSRHNELRRKYRNFRFAHPDERPTSSKSIDALTWFVPQLLVDIAWDPSVASYIIHADLGERNHTEGHQPDNTSLRVAIEQLDAPENKDKLRDLLWESWHLRSIGADIDQWLDHILEDDGAWDQRCEFGLVFLMSLLVNLESLVLPGSWQSANAEPMEDRWEDVDPFRSEVSQLMQSLIKLANDGTSHQWPLKKLQKLLPSHHPDEQNGLQMMAIAPFMSLQSMRDIRHASGKYMCDERAPSWDTIYPVIGPNIESLELLDYVIDEDASATLFKDMKKLKMFKMEYSMKDEIGYEWRANDFVHNLMSAVGNQLEVLSLRIYDLHENTGAVTDLSGFTVLQELELDVELFYCWGLVDDDEYRSQVDALDKKLSILDMLTASLPSLKELRLQCLSIARDVERLEILLRDFGSRKSLQLPRLVTTEVYLRTDGNPFRYEKWVNMDDHVRQAQKICREIGNIGVKTSETLDL